MEEVDWVSEQNNTKCWYSRILVPSYQTAQHHIPNNGHYLPNYKALHTKQWYQYTKLHIKSQILVLHTELHNATPQIAVLIH